MSEQPFVQWLVCRCGEAVREEDIDRHFCRPIDKRPPQLYMRWMDPRIKREILRYLELHGEDPAFSGNQQTELYHPGDDVR